MFYVYIVECADGTYYTGATTDLTKRVQQHNQGSTGAKYTHARRPVRLIHTETHDTWSLALKREATIKKMTRLEKEHLIR